VRCGASGLRTRRWWFCVRGWRSCRRGRPIGCPWSKAAPIFTAVSIDTIYRALREQFRPRSLHRRDRGRARKIGRKEMEQLLRGDRRAEGANHQLEAAASLDRPRDRAAGRTGIDTPDGLLKIDGGVLTRSTVNRYLRVWGWTMSGSTAATAVRFQAEHSNDCWQFDLSPSTSAGPSAPLGRGRARPATLMLFSAVDDRSG